jgi:hypothetical protein
MKSNLVLFALAAAVLSGTAHAAELAVEINTNVIQSQTKSYSRIIRNMDQILVFARQNACVTKAVLAAQEGGPYSKQVEKLKDTYADLLNVSNRALDISPTSPFAKIVFVANYNLGSRELDLVSVQLQSYWSGRRSSTETYYPPFLLSDMDVKNCDIRGLIEKATSAVENEVRSAR